jgi:hypothetical protein
MDKSAQYGQMDFNLPHDVVKLPSGGMFYKPKKESLKVGYLTASDENLLMSPNTPSDGIINNLLRTKIYEPGFDVGQLLDVDVQAILIFLRNTSFGNEYEFSINDPKTNKRFDAKILLDELNYIPMSNKPDSEGLFDFVLPKSRAQVKLKLLTLSETNELEKLQENYPPNMVAPVITKRLEKQIVELNGDRDKLKIVQFVTQMPIIDSKELRKFIRDCEPKIDLKRTITAPSGERVTVNVSFGAEFFRPFFSI